VDSPNAEGNVETWIAQLGERTSVSASVVQNHLLDLWGLLPEGDGRRLVEQWLLETLERELYRTDDVIDRLRDLPELDVEGSGVA
jgi:hypothetical protein